jgi:hypothetical protein
MVTTDEVIDEAESELADPVMTREEVAEYLRDLDPIKFERLYAKLKQRDGNAAVATRASKDRKIDVVVNQRVASNRPRRTLVQVKRHTGNTSPSDIEKYDVLTKYGDEVEFVTTGSLSDAARETAHDLGIRLVDTDDIYELIRELEAWDLITERPLSKATRTHIRRADIIIGIVCGAAGIKYDTNNSDALVPVNLSDDPEQVFIDAVIALFDHGILHPDDIESFGTSDDPLFVRHDPNAPEVYEDDALIRLTDDWYIRLPEDPTPEKLMTRLKRIIRRVMELREIPRGTDSNEMWW